MADRAEKVSENVRGRFFVDSTCIDCELCHELAPRNFTRQAESGYSYVYHQPSSPEEEAACESARLECPVEAIGNDGDA